MISADTDMDKVIAELIDKQIKRLSGVKQVRAGIKEQAYYPPEMGGEKISIVALKNEDGDEDHPARPFLRPTLKNNFEKYFRMFVSLIKKNLILLQASHRIGLEMQTDIKKKIRSNIPPPNTKMTIDLYEEKYKTRDKKTLIFSGLMFDSVDYEVIKDKTE